MTTAMRRAMDQALEYQRKRPAIVAAGEPALARLASLAVRPTGQSAVLGRFLLGLYDGQTYPFNLTELRGLDLDLFEDCMRVVMMDYSPDVEVHQRVPNGPAIWRELAAMWGKGVAR